MEQQPENLTMREVCDRLRISRQTVRRLIDNGDLKAIRVGNGPNGQLIVTSASYREFIKDRTVKAAS
jgi:excisionase family DNA binding protein